MLTVEGSDSSKVFPSDNQHVHRCCLPTRRGGVRKSHLTLPHRFPSPAVRPFEERS
ncbi:unnamed protein product [Schistosoma margrebowiei]|uniref:Uncharacterized protein n=1 Tax=Schistosoma margrebowiei TaxID=48269 RepID=A0A3P8CWM4_9TREM|nr:unnamed protein product [Schistosoma margrebowiei]